MGWGCRARLTEADKVVDAKENRQEGSIRSPLLFHNKSADNEEGTGHVDIVDVVPRKERLVVGDVRDHDSSEVPTGHDCSKTAGSGRDDGDLLR